MSDKDNTDNGDDKLLYCSFCGKNQNEVRKLIAGPTVFICDECVELCMDIIKEENKSHLIKGRDLIEHRLKHLGYPVLTLEITNQIRAYFNA